MNPGTSSHCPILQQIQYNIFHSDYYVQFYQNADIKNHENNEMQHEIQGELLQTVAVKCPFTPN